jgi:methylmalonyl-CoA mutase N-terminal domain/subunit
MEIARLRAARLLWAKIVQAFGGNAESQKMRIHARTSAWNQTVYDPHVNLLRGTTEAFSAVVGGCDSLHISPFDELVRVPDEFSRRVARNTHTVLREETHITRTVDPAGGSWYVETLTDAVARQTWTIFQEVEKQGGMSEGAAEAGWPQSQIADTAAKRAANIAKRKDIFVGTNMYPNMKETRIEPASVDAWAVQTERTAAISQFRATANADQKQAALDALAKAGTNSVDAAIQAALTGASLGEIAQAARTGAKAGPTTNPVHAHRGAQAFEALRQAAETYVARTGQRPLVFLATMGPLTQHKGRADFSTAFLGVGGFETIYPTRFQHPRRSGGRSVGFGRQGRGDLLHRPDLPRHRSAAGAETQAGQRRRGAALPARPLPGHVRHPAVDGAPVRRLLHRRRVQRLLSPQSGGGPERLVHRLRPGHPPRLRLRPPSAWSAMWARPAWPSTRFWTCRILFDGIPLDQMSVSMTMNGAVLPVLAFYIVAAEEQGVPHGQLTGTIQNDILKEFMVRNTYIYPPEPSRCASSATSSPTRPRRCRSSTASRSPATTCRKPARRPTWNWPTPWPTVWNMCAPASAGMDIDTFAPRLSFFWAIGMNYFMEVAKMRAARLLWAKIIKQFNPKNDKSMACAPTSQTSAGA